MHNNEEIREEFYKTLRAEVLKISNLPVISEGTTKQRADKNKQETLFQHYLKKNIEQDPDVLKTNEEEGKFADDALTEVDEIEKRIRDPKRLLTKDNINAKIPKTKTIPDMLYNTITHTKIHEKSLVFKGFVAAFSAGSNQEVSMHDVRLLQTVCSNNGFYVVQHKFFRYEQVKHMLFQKECLIESDIVTAPDFEEIFVNTEGLDMRKMHESQRIIQQKVEDLEYRSEMYKSKRKRRLTRKEQMTVIKLLEREGLILSKIDEMRKFGRFPEFTKDQERLIRGIDDSSDSPTKADNLSPQIGDANLQILKESQNMRDEISTPKALQNMIEMNKHKKESLNGKDLNKYLNEVQTKLAELEYDPLVDRLGGTQRSGDASFAGTSTNFKTYDRQNEHIALLLCIVPKSGRNSYEEFRKMLEAKSKYFSSSLAFFYSSENRIESIIDTQIFFPNFFQVEFMSLIGLPSINVQSRGEAIKKMDEILELNNFRVVKRLVATIKKEHLLECLEHVFSNYKNLVDYLLTEHNIRIQIIAKIGSLSLNEFGQSSENFLKVSDQEANFRLFKHFFTDIYKFSRVVVVLRPFIKKSRLSELFLNVFRINGFVIVKRINFLLTENQATYLATHEEIKPENKAQYLNLMTDSDCEIVLMSNYGAIDKASVIIDGSNNEYYRLKQLFDINFNEDDLNPFAEEPEMLFKSFKDTIGLLQSYEASTSKSHVKSSDERLELSNKSQLTRALLSSSFNCVAFASKSQETTEELVSLFLPDCSEVSSIYVILKPSYKNLSDQLKILFDRLGYKIVDEKKHTISKLKDLGKFLQCLSKEGDQTAEYKVSVKQTHEWENNEFSIFNLVKPAGRKEMLSILRNFFLDREDDGFVYERKADNKIDMTQNVEGTEKKAETKQNIEGAEKKADDKTDTTQNIEGAGKTNKTEKKVYFFDLMKTENEEKEDKKKFVKQIREVNKDNLYKILVPCWSSASINWINTREYKILRDFNAEKYQSAKDEEKELILNYILQSTIGTPIMSSNKEEKEKNATKGVRDSVVDKLTSLTNEAEQDHFELDDVKKAKLPPKKYFEDISPFDRDHISVKAESKSHGDYLIRIRNFESRSYQFMRNIKEEYDRIAYYYSNVNKYYLQKCPSFYQYRFIPDLKDLVKDKADLDQASTVDGKGIIPNHIFDCQEYMGDFFLKEIAKEIQEHQKKFKDRGSAYDSDLYKSKSNSISSFMFGARLATYIKKLEKIERPAINGFGSITMFDEKPRGVWPYEHMMLLEYTKYNDILLTMANHVGIDSTVNNHIGGLIDTIFYSETYKYSRRVENLRLVPEFLNPLSLRVFRKGDNREMRTVHDAYKTLNYDFEKTNYTREVAAGYNKDFALTYVFPQISGKYSLIANIMYLLQYEFSIFNRRVDVIVDADKDKDKVRGEEVDKDLQHEMNKLSEVEKQAIAEEEYDSLVKGILGGLLKHHEIDEEDEAFLAHEREKAKDNKQPVDFLQMETFFILLQAISSKIHKLSEIRDSTKEGNNFLRANQSKEFTHNDTAKDIETYDRQRRMRNEELHRLDQEEEAVIREIRLLIDKVKDINLCPTLDEKGVVVGNKIKIARDRYFKPLFQPKTEKDLLQDKYKRKVTNYYKFDESKYKDYKLFEKPDETQAKWLQPDDLYVYDVKREHERKFPDLYVDRIIVPGEIQEKKLIKASLIGMEYFKTTKK